MKKQNTKEKMAALSQIFLLVVAVFAFAWILGSFQNVSANNNVAKNACEKQGGTCMDTSLCKRAGGTSTSGLCPGPAENQCCTGIDYSNANAKEVGAPFSSNIAKNALVGGVVAKGLDEIPLPSKKSPSSLKPVQIGAGAVAGAGAAGAAGTAGTAGAGAAGAGAAGTAGAGAAGAGAAGAGAAGAAGAGAGAGGVTPNGFLGINEYGTIGNIAGAAAVAVTFSYLGQQFGGTGATKDLIGATLGAGATIGFFALTSGLAAVGPVGWGIVITAFIVNLFIKHTKEEGVVYFYCQPWSAAVGGNNCHLCNEQIVGGQKIPCTEYQCKSLGQRCEFVQSDPKQGGDSFCFWNNKNDIQPPVINASVEALSTGYEYRPYNPVPSYPEERGVIIKDTKSSDGCISPFSKLTFGVSLNEPANCKIDFQRPVDYKSMAQYMGGISTNHNQTILVPALNKTLGKDNLLDLFVRCQDSNGNADPHDFVFQMCLQKGPDTTPPQIKLTSPENGAQIPHSETNAKADFYVNEPATCKWDFKDLDYDKMSYNMTCATKATQLNNYLSYTCSANLTGIKSTAPTNYFVRCRDQPNVPNVTKNTNSQSYKYTLQSSEALVISSVSPNNTEIRDSTNPSLVTINAKTIGGTYDGRALCYVGEENSRSAGIKYTVFDNSGNSSVHSTVIPVSTNGEHTYYVKCEDGAGNSDTEKINFNVSIDLSPPTIARAYYDSGNLKFITDEKANCAYSTSGCDFTFNVNQNDGVAIDNGVLQTDHIVDWKTDTDLNIKCLDSYGNGPSTGKCTMSLRAEDKSYL